MQIRITNMRLLIALGFTPSGDGPMVVEQSLGLWLLVIRNRLGRA